MRKSIWLLMKYFFTLGNLSIPDICDFSKRFWDIHDYPEEKGGTGYPDHFHLYVCWHCGKEFYI